MYKIVAMDLDETLLNDHHQICERNKMAIQKAKALGVKIVPCSGRGPGFLGSILEELDLEKANEYSILANGGVIVDNANNDIIHCDPLDYDSLEKLFHFGRERNLGIEIFTPDNVYFYYCDENEITRCRSFGKNLVFKEEDDIEIFKDMITFKMLFVKNDMPYLLSLQKELEPITNNKVCVSFSSERYVELNRLGVNKGKGLKHLANYLNIDIQDTIGIGDNFNDIDLIETAGLGATVSNAKVEAKQKANYHCVSDNNEGGVGEVIEKFILNSKE